MILDPQFTGPFTVTESSVMAIAYALAKAELSSTHHVNDKTKYMLASVILYMFMCEKRHGAADGIDIKAFADEALECFLKILR